MPIPPIIGAMAAQTGQQLLSGGVQSIFNFGQHRRNLEYYQMQRQDALNDWNRQVEYNSPANQVQRLKEAGISPHSMGGHGVQASVLQSQPRGANMGNAPSSYQVNGAINTMNQIQAIEQIKNLRAQNEKTQAETASVREDTRQKQLNYDVDAETLRSRRLGEIWTAAKHMEVSDADIQQKRQTVENMKTQLLSITEDIALKRTQNVYEAPLLSGKVDLQNAQKRHISNEIAKIQAEIQRIQVQNDRDVKLLPFDISSIVQKIQQLKLGNERADYENYFEPENLRIHRDTKEAEMESKQYQRDRLKTLSPEMREILDRVPELMQVIRPRGGTTFNKHQYFEMVNQY